MSNSINHWIISGIVVAVLFSQVVAEALQAASSSAQQASGSGSAAQPPAVAHRPARGESVATPSAA